MTARLLEQFDVSEETLRRIVAETVAGADDGELFVEYREGEALVFDNGRLKTANFNTEQGFGLRAVAGEAAGYAHAGELSQAALLRASSAVSAVKAGYSGTLAEAPSGTNVKLYGEENPIAEPGFADKAKLLQEVDAYLRNKDPRVRQVTASVAASWQHVEILRADGRVARDIRPLVRFNVSVVVGEGDRQETGSYGMGGRKGFGEFLAEAPGSMPARKRCARHSSTSRRSRRPPAPSTSFFRPAGRASCCTRRSATASKATSTARKHRPLPG